MFQAVCVTKEISLGQFDTRDEALSVANKHSRRSGHRVRVFDISEEVPKSTGKELINDEVDSALEIFIPPADTEDTDTDT